MEEIIKNLPWVDELALIVVYFVGAWLLALIIRLIISRLLTIGRIFQDDKHSKEREKTLRSLISNAVNLAAMVTAAILSLSLFVGLDTLVWMVGFFSAAFGFGARMLISDFLAGLSFIFEDTYSVGEKIELVGIQPIEGVVEAVNLRTTFFRAPTGELFVVPNGEIRTVRNFSRGKFSVTKLKLKFSTGDIGRAAAVLEEFKDEAVMVLPYLIEPWQILSTNKTIGACAELSVIARAKFGKAAKMKPRLLKLIHEKLGQEGIELAE